MSIGWIEHLIYSLVLAQNISMTCTYIIIVTIRMGVMQSLKQNTHYAILYICVFVVPEHLQNERYHSCCRQFFFSIALLWAKLFQYTSLRAFVCIATATNYFLLRIKGMVLFEIPCRNKLCSLFAKPKPSDSSTIYAIAVREREKGKSNKDWQDHVAGACRCWWFVRLLLWFEMMRKYEMHSIRSNMIAFSSSHRHRIIHI